MGDPNTGKSNILEAFAFLNPHDNLTDFIRFREVSHLFYEYDNAHDIVIKADEITAVSRIQTNGLKIQGTKVDKIAFEHSLAMDGKSQGYSSSTEQLDWPKILTYKYNPDIIFGKGERHYLEEPFGKNLPSVLLTNRELHAVVKNLLDDFDYKLLIKPLGDDFEIIRDRDGSYISFPLVLMSDSLKRIIFNLAVVKSNEMATIILEEPEAKTFPFYIKAFAELMAKQETNQYFVVTHNAHFLLSSIEKTPIEDLSVNIVYSHNYATKVASLTPNQIESILDYGSDFFINFDKFIDA